MQERTKKRRNSKNKWRKRALSEVTFMLEDVNESYQELKNISPETEELAAAIATALTKAKALKGNIPEWRPDAKAHEVVAATRARIEDPARWTQGIAARTQDGTEVGASHFAAYSFCLTGALDRTGEEKGFPHGRELREYLDEWLEQKGLAASAVELNDEKGHAAIIAALDLLLEELANAGK